VRAALANDGEMVRAPVYVAMITDQTVPITTTNSIAPSVCPNHNSAKGIQQTLGSAAGQRMGDQRLNMSDVGKMADPRRDLFRGRGAAGREQRGDPEQEEPVAHAFSVDCVGAMGSGDCRRGRPGRQPDFVANRGQDTNANQLGRGDEHLTAIDPFVSDPKDSRAR
jgi:hypothetical protein